MTVLLAGLAVAGLAGDAATGGQTRFPTVKTFIQLLDTARVQAMTQGQLATIARQNAVVVLNAWQFRLIPVLKRANPAVQAWVYKNLSGCAQTTAQREMVTAARHPTPVPPGHHRR